MYNLKKKKRKRSSHRKLIIHPVRVHVKKKNEKSGKTLKEEIRARGI